MKLHSRTEIEHLLIGRKIARIIWRESDPLSGQPLAKNDLDVLSFQLDDGSVLTFHGAEQIGLSAVWLTLETLPG